MPILKQLVSRSSVSKRRSRSDLTVDMISMPLADFRHTMHIGRGGDVFGDTSFLNVLQPSANQEHKNRPMPPRLSKNSVSERSSSAASYMLPANSVSSALYMGEDQDTKLPLPNSTSLPFPETNDEMSWRSLETDERQFGEPRDLPVFTPPSGRAMKHAESMMSFHIDLGPSMLADVLGVMDQTKQDCTDDQRQSWDMPRPIQSKSASSLGVKQENTHMSEEFSVSHAVNNHDDFLFMDEDEDEIRL